MPPQTSPPRPHDSASHSDGEPGPDSLLGALGEGVYGLDREQRTIFLNPAACRMLGWRREELMGRRPHPAIHLDPEGRPCSDDSCAVHRVLRDGRTRRVDREAFCRKDGSVFPVEYTAAAVVEGEAVVGAVVVFRDVSERVGTALAEEAGADLSDGGVRVLVVDDHPAMREGIRAALDYDPTLQVVGEAGDGEEAVRKALALHPDVMVVDLDLPMVDGFEVIRRVDQARPGGRTVRMLVLSGLPPEESLMKAMEAGASGFVRKSAAHRELTDALRAVLRGEIYLDAQAKEVLVRATTRARAVRRLLGELTEQERDVIRLTAEGYTAREAGQKLFLSPHTVASYRSQAMRKLELEHRSDVVHFALATGLLEP